LTKKNNPIFSKYPTEKIKTDKIHFRNICIGNNLKNDFGHAAICSQM
jgi:hypothetical protein